MAVNNRGCQVILLFIINYMFLIPDGKDPGLLTGLHTHSTEERSGKAGVGLKGKRRGSSSPGLNPSSVSTEREKERDKAGMLKCLLRARVFAMG